jgi:2-amino-4-hydroxy-6-hydroxymethyldihydropteridine diphosphokinase
MVAGRNAEIAWIGLGSNVGERIVNLARAATDLSLLPHTSLFANSSIYKSPPFGTGFTADFYNAVVGLLTGLQPDELLSECLKLEAEMGRDRKQQDRTIDIDILLYGDQIISTANLTVPHPEMEKRRFVLEPLAEVAPKVIHPIHKIEIRHLLEDRSWTQPIEKLRQPLIPTWGC